MSEIRFCFLFFSLIYAFIVPGLGQPVNFKHITIEDGLSQSWAHVIYQDRYGFIWVGTDDGLNRYDGYNFRIYKNNPRNNHTILSNSIYSLYEDAKGRFWVGTSSGLNLYDREKDEFIQKPHWPKDVINSIVEDDLHNLWMGTSGCLYCYNTKNDSFTSYKPTNDSQGNGRKDIGSISSSYVTKVFIDSRKNFWIASNCGLNLYNKENNTFVNYYHKDKDPKSLMSDNVNAIFEDHSGRLWIGTYGGLELFTNAMDRPERAVFAHFRNDEKNSQSISSGSILALLEDEKQKLWIGTENGGLNVLDLRDFDANNCRFTHYRNDPNNVNSLSHNAVYSLFMDKQRNIWVGTYGKGINIFSRLANKFMHFTNDPYYKVSLNNNQVNTFFEDDDFIWIGTEGGLNCFNKKEKKFSYFTHNPFNKSSLSSNAVWAIHKDRQGDLWVGTWAGGLNRFNYKTKTFTHFVSNPKNENSLSSNNVFSITEDQEGILWIGTMGGGLNSLDAKRKNFTRFTKDNSGIHYNYIESVVETKNGDLWMIDLSSLDCYVKATNKFEYYFHNLKDTTSLHGGKIFALYEDSKGNFWVGTDAGLNLFQKSTKRFTYYSMEQGLPDNAVKSIVEDKHGNLWLGTNNGISCFANAINLPQHAKFKNFTEEDGLQGKEFTKRSCLASESGLVYFGGVNGLNVFNPDSVKDNPYIPNVFITDFLIFNKPIIVGAKGSPLKQNIVLTKELKLSYAQSVFSFKFAALNYVSPQKNQYAYMMEGFEKSWNYVGNKREATYTNLNPGEYIFHVKASNNDGVWNEEGASLKITILPPWWKTIWFRLLMIGLLLSIPSIVVYLVIAAQRNRRRKLEHLVQLRTQELETINLELLQERVVIEEQKESLESANVALQEKNMRIQEYAEEAYAQTEQVKSVNEQLINQRKHIEAQSEELRTHSENLKVANNLLIEKQRLIQLQSNKLEESNQELSVLNTTKDRLFSIIAHDLRNPFNAVSGFSELLLRDYKKMPPEKIEKFLHLINKSSVNGSILLENLLQWSRAKTGKITFNPERLNLGSLSAEVVSFQEIEAQRKNISIINTIENGIAVSADENMLKTVLRNLLSNAVKFTGENGKVTLQSSQKESHVEISISDTGIGISPQNIILLFNAETNISTKGTASESGTGLGLILCKEFVERNGGEIRVESEVGKGSTFTFTLLLA